MKTIAILIATIFSIQIIAENNSSRNQNKYCCEMKNGRTVVMHEGKEITTNQTLTDGTIVKTDGIILKKDGSRTMLKEGECMDLDGKVKSKKTKKKEKAKMESPR